MMIPTYSAGSRDPEWFLPRHIVVLVLLLSLGGCGNDRLSFGPPDRGPVDLTSTNLIALDGARVVADQIPRLSR